MTSPVLIERRELPGGERFFRARVIDPDGIDLSPFDERVAVPVVMPNEAGIMRRLSRDLDRVVAANLAADVFYETKGSVVIIE